MENAYYSSVGIMATILSFIISYEILFRPSKKAGKLYSYYRYFIISTIVYYIVDAGWGVLSQSNLRQLLYLDTSLCFVGMAVSVVLWVRYVIVFLNVKRKFTGRFLNAFSSFFLLAQILALIVNIFNPVFYSYDELDHYHADTLRYVFFALLVMIYFLIALQSTVVAFRKTGRSSKRNIAILFFSAAMCIATMVQFCYPLFPIYSLGLILGTCILHTFVQEDEKEEIRHEYEEKTEIIANAGYGIWKIEMFEDGKNTMTADKKLQHILGINKMNLTPSETYEFYHGRLQEDVEDIERNDYEDMFSGKLRSRLLRWEHPAKGMIYLRAGGTLHRETNGDVVISGYCGDVTDQIVAEEKMNKDLEEAKRKAEAANKAKSTFLFNMSHDIRTPMNAIIGFTMMMEKYKDDPERCSDYRKKILSSSQLLLSLINNVLEMARIESGKIVLDETCCNCQTFFEMIQNVFGEQMKEKNISFTMLTEVEHEYIYLDAVKLREIFLNLLSNAYKYTNEGGSVAITVKEIPCKKEGFASYRTIVSDTGIGMSEEFLPTLFEEFTREKTYTDSKIEGTGLGMPIVKKYVDLMGGSLEVESKLGVGTTFILTLTHKIASVHQNEETASEVMEQNRFDGMRLLLAEDNELNAEIAMDLFTEVGFLVDHARDGIICVDMLQKAKDNYYDIILMDLQMPNMDGYKATQTIRAMESTYCKNIPIIAMTANAFEEDKKKVLEVGMNGHIAKPVDLKELMMVLNEILHGNAT